MENRTKITEIKETYTVKSRIRGDGLATDGTKFENKTLIRYKEVTTVEGWPRFGHFMLDRVFFYVFAIILGVMAGTVTALTDNVGFWDTPLADFIINMITYFILFPGYYLFFEYFMQSSPGKLVLGRIVVNEYGEKPTFKQILIRSYSRIVPFEAFSCCSELGWHDKWSNTLVIRKKDLYELQLIIKAQEFGDDSKNTMI